MEKFIVKKRDGSEIDLNSFRANSYVLNAELTKSSSNENYVSVELQNGNSIDFQIGDSIFFDGMEYFINTIPDTEQDKGLVTKYKITFEAVNYLMNRIICLSSNGLVDFPFTARITDLLHLVQTNVNRSGLFEIVEFVYNEENETFFDFDVSSQNVLNVLYSCLEDNGLNYKFEFLAPKKYRLIVATNVGSDLDVNLEYGATDEIVTISKSNGSSENSIVNRLYLFGGSNNVPVDYYNGIGRIILPNGLMYLQDSTSIRDNGLFESTKTYDDIFPTFTDDVDETNTNANEFIVYDLPFDINAWLAPGLTPKVSFKSGNLVGYDFEIIKYERATGLVRLKTIVDDLGIERPNHDMAYKINVGDKFTLLDINMPTRYINDAETRLLNIGASDLAIMRYPTSAYSVDLNPNFTFSKIDVFDSVLLNDNIVNLNFRIKVDSLNFDILNNKLIGFTLSNVKQKSANSKMLEENLFIQKTIKQNQFKLMQWQQR